MGGWARRLRRNREKELRRQARRAERNSGRLVGNLEDAMGKSTELVRRMEKALANGDLQKFDRLRAQWEAQSEKEKQLSGALGEQSKQNERILRMIKGNRKVNGN